MKTKHVYLGRFSPFHLGHQAMINRLITEQGEANTLIIVGSSNSYNERTPYTFPERCKMIETVFPNMEVIALPDGKPDLVYFDGSTNDIWLKSIKKLEIMRGEKFIFYGGGVTDLEVLSRSFETIVLLDRENNCNGVSATKVRKALEENDTKMIEMFLDPRIIPLAISGFANYKKNIKQ